MFDDLAAVDRALYFPFIEVPDSPALTRVLLYWDELGTIVPVRLRNSDIESRTRELANVGLVIPIYPEEHAERIFGSDEEFIALVAALPAAQHHLPPVVIHRDKGTSDIWSVLEDRGLARPSPNEGRWLMVDARVGALFMGHLAARLARLPEFNMEPITDQRHYFRSLDSDGTLLDTAALFDGLRGAVLHDVLPAPLEPVNPREIAEFKERHWELLGRFRREIERRSALLRVEPDARAAFSPTHQIPWVTVGPSYSSDRPRGWHRARLQPTSFDTERRPPSPTAHVTCSCHLLVRLAHSCDHRHRR